MAFIVVFFTTMMVFLFYSLPFASSMSLFLGTLIIFLIKSKTRDFICLDLRSIQASTMSVNLWFSMCLTTTTVSITSKNQLAPRISNLNMMVYAASSVALLLSILLKQHNLGIDKVNRGCCYLKSPFECVHKLEMINWMHKTSEEKGRVRIRKIFEGFFESYITQGKEGNAKAISRSTTRALGDEAENRSLLVNNSRKKSKRCQKQKESWWWRWGWLAIW